MDPSPFNAFRFSIDDFPEHDRIETVCEIYGRTIIKHDIEPISDAPFHFDADLCSVPGLGIGSVSISPCRAPRRIEHIDGDDLILHVSLNGGRTVEQRGRKALVAEGEAILTTGADAGLVTILSMSRLISLRLPQRALRSAVADFDACLLRPLRRDTPALNLLKQYVEAIRKPGVLATPALRGVVVAHVYDLVALVLGAERDARQIAEQRGLRAARRMAVLHAVESRSGDPALRAATVAAELGVTPRYVHLLLEETGRSFTHHVLDKRLEKVLAMLRDPRWQNRRITDMALEAGFTDLSYFGRAFRRRYGATPSDVRETARRDFGGNR